MNVPAFLTECEVNDLVEHAIVPSSRPRYRLLRDVPDVDLQAGAIGSVVLERSGDDRQFVLLFDCRPGLRVTFYEPEFMRESPEYLLEAIP